MDRLRRLHCHMLSTICPFLQISKVCIQRKVGRKRILKKLEAYGPPPATAIMFQMKKVFIHKEAIEKIPFSRSRPLPTAAQPSLNAGFCPCAWNASTMRHSGIDISQTCSLPTPCGAHHLLWSITFKQKLVNDMARAPFGVHPLANSAHIVTTKM